MAETKTEKKSGAGRPLRFSEPLDHNGFYPAQNEWIKKTVKKVVGMYKTDIIRAAVWLLMKEAGEEIPEDWDEQLKYGEIV